MRVPERSSKNPPISAAWFLFLLLSIFLGPSDAFRKPRGRLLGQSLLPFGYSFEFTNSEYNISLKENTRNRAFVQLDEGEKIGVFLPPIFSKIKFKIVDGDKDKLFVANHLVLGDFAFLQITPEKGEILNRERKGHYELLVKATLKRKNANTLETTSKVNLKILDENDNNPMFRKVEYEAGLDTTTPLNARVLKLDAFDADEGLNAELYYSMTNPLNDSVVSQFYIDPRTGWIRTFSRLSPGNYSIDCFVEDRTSRLQFYSAQDSPKPAFIRNRAKARVIVKSAPEEELKVAVERFPLRPFSRKKQLGAKIKIEENARVVLTGKSNNFWIEENSDGFNVFVGKTKNEKLSTEIQIFEPVSNGKNVSKKIEFEMDSKRKISFKNFEVSQNLQVNESVPVGYIVYQFAVENGFKEELDSVKYRLRTEAKEFPFHLDRNTGQLKIKEKLDYETSKSYEFTVIAKLEGFEDVKESFPVKVTVIDSNDNCPDFIKVPENFKVLLPSPKNGTKIFEIKAVDSDSGENGKVFYKLRSSGNLSNFEIDSESGVITVARKLESKTKSWKITVIAFDAGFPVSLASEVELEIFSNSEDLKKSSKTSKISSSCQIENKHSPKFSKLPEAIVIKEDTPSGTAIGRITATDADYGINGIVQFTTADEYFEVDVFSGEIKVKQVLTDLFDKFNKGQEVVNYQLEVTASDMGGFVNPKSAFLSSKSVIEIRIQDVNNFAPEFEFENYFSEIFENAEAGIELLRVRAIDKDPGKFGKVEYILGIESDLISIDPDTGVVKTEKSFDREISPKNGEFHFLLAAFDRADPSRFGFTNLTVKVADQNDNVPQCLNEIQEFKVLEDAPRGQLIGCLAASDADEGPNAEFFFNLIKTVPKVPFRVDSASGCLFLDSTVPLSADRHSRYSFNVTVSDKGNPVLSSICQVKLDLIKVNQNLLAAEFSEVAIEASVKENLPAGTEVLQVKATDPEGKQVKYELVGGSGLGYFEIDEDSGMVSTVVILDYEATPSYWLTVKATDTDEKPLSGYLHVLVRVLDMNDRAPLFEKPIYFVNVEENSADNKVILKLEAEDADGQRIDDSEGLLRFSIVKGNTQSLFHIDPNTGYLVTGKRHLDRETQKEHELVVRVCDTSSFQSIGSSLCADALVIVTVDDVNDNKPLFNTTTSLNVQVPADKIGFLTRIFANDADSDGQNSEIEYSFIGPLEDPRLRIDKYGRISTIEALPSGKEVHISVLAKDNGEPRMNSSIMLTLEPLGRSRKSASNNHKPKFIEKDSWKELYVSDSDPVGVIVGLIRAEDDDNDPLWFGIASDSENPNETFAFKSSTGELILARSVNLIDPNLSEVKLSVIVSDGIAEVVDKLVIKISRSAIAPRPEFEKSSDSLILKSNSPVGMVVYTAKAKFDESRTGISHPHRLLYSIHHIDDVIARDFLRIDPHSGQLVLEKPLSSQISKNFTLIISAKVGSAENFLQLFVTKENSNENPPKFISKNFVFGVERNPKSEFVFGKVRAFDIDKDEVSFSIISGNEFGLFSIDPKSGELKTTKLIPDLFKEAILTLRVTDSGDPQKSSTSIARIFIQETTETIKPVFESESLQIHLSDETQVGKAVAQARLIPDFGSLQTSIVFDGFCEFFDIHFVSGVIRLKKTLPMKNTDWMINCTIFAVNEGGNNATVDVHAKVLSTFSRCIRFSSPVSDSFIEENATPGSPLYSDSNQTSPLSLEILSASGSKPKLKILSPRESHFSIDPISGGIRVMNPLDYETDKQWEFYVTSNQLGHFPHFVSDPVLIKVEVGNMNDVFPNFSVLGDEFEVLLPPIEGTKIGKLKAEDKDGNDVINYGLKSSEFSKLFFVNRATGDLILATNKSSNFKSPVFMLPVVASDGLHSASTNVKITVVDSSTKDVPTNRLRFSKPNYKISLRENSTSISRNLISFELESAEKSEAFRFELLTSNPAFEVLGTAGILRVLDGKLIDRENTPGIELLIKATSLNNPKRSTTTVVTIEVEDVNDSSPEFLNLPFEVLLSEDAAPGDKLVSVKAKDKDLGTNSVLRYSLATDAPRFLDINNHNRYFAKISESSSVGSSVISVRATSKSDGVIGYRIKSGDDGKHFSIDFNTGLITVNKNLDKEENPGFKLIVEAIDVTRNVPGVATVEIDLEDVNDSPPVFEKLLYSFEVMENLVVGSLIGQVKAMDSEGSSITYSVAEGNKTVITVDSSSGMIHLNSELDREETDFYEFTVIARDQDRHASEAIVQLKVLDVNDFPPEFFNKNPVKINLEIEELKLNQFIYQLSARDKDLTSSLQDKKKFIFTIIDGDETLFQIDPFNGVIRSSTNFSKNNLLEFSENNGLKRKLNISVSDGLFQDFIAVEISIKMRNKKIQSSPLHFDQTSFATVIEENRSNGNKSSVLTLLAKGGIKPIRYSVAGKTTFPVTVERSTGKNGYITVKQSFTDLKQLPQTMEFFVRASDAGNPPHSSQVRMEMRILDVPNIVPQFSRLHYTFAVSEDSQMDKIVGQLQSEDNQAVHVQKDLVFKIISKNSENLPFSLDQKTGKISLKGKLDREAVEKYNFVVELKANDGLYSFALVTVVVMDVNDNGPVFSTFYDKISVPEDALVGTVLATFVASDADDGVNGHVSYSLEQEGFDVIALSHFQIDKEYGWLTVSKELDREVRSLFNFKVIASDDSGKSSSAVLTVEVEDVNDSEPKFEKEKYEITLEPEKTKLGDTVMEFNVTDDDSVGNIELFITSGDDEGLFEIQKTFLKLKTTPPEDLKEKTLEVTASDGSHSNSILVFIKFVSSEKSSRVSQNRASSASHCPEEFQELKVSGNLNPGHSILKLPSGGKDEFVINHLLDSERLPFGIKDESNLVVKEGYSKKRSYLLKIKTKREFKNPAKLEPSCLQRINLTIENANTMSPRFEKKVYTVKVKENAPVTPEKSFYLIQVEAVDEDYGVFGDVKYSVLNSTGEDGVFEVQESTGAFLLKKELDREKTGSYEIFIKAMDGGGLFDLAKIAVVVEDVNDNSPIFEKAVYRMKILEDEAVGYELVKVKAVDEDSKDEIKYYLQENEHSSFVKNLLRINIKAKDGGEPPQSDDTLVSITVSNENDNLPEFENCQMEAIVQEGAAPGHGLLNINVKDKDAGSSPESIKLELLGEGSDNFGLDQENRLIVIKKLSFEKKSVYKLKVKATDEGGKSTVCQIDIEVKKTSTHPPELKPLIITLNTLHGEFLGGSVGKVEAVDKDPGDTLRFNLVDSEDRRQISKFHINKETGELSADSDLLPGLHRLNVSVTDGKFTEYGRIDVDISNIDQDSLDHAVSLRLKNISGKKFIKHFMRRFHEIMAHLLGVPTTDLRFLSIQEIEKNQNNLQPTVKPKTGKFFGQLTGANSHKRRHRRADEDTDLDILFTVSRGENHGYHRPPWVRQNIEKQISELSTESGLEVASLTSEVCRRDVCVKGECRDRLWMDNAEGQIVYEVDGNSFVSPKHLRTFECLCKQGFSGRNCAVPVNVCSKELCTKHEMCIPSDDEPSGFRCVCPPGFKGSQCSEPTCDDPSSCSQKEELSLMGNGYVQLFVANSMETRLELSVQFRTVSSNAILMHGEGLKDFHSIRIQNGSISYVWDCGTGSQEASISNIKVDDGSWHEFKVARRGRHVRIVLDNVHEADSTSPSGSDVVNLFNQAALLTFGARVIDPILTKHDSSSKISTEDWFRSLSTSSSREIASDLYTKVEEGMIGCLGRISFDGFDLSKTAQGMKLFNAKIGCDTTTMGPCLASPCANGGQCLPSASDSFTCSCPKRYTGTNCEIDLNACESKPCPNGIVCHNLYNDFHCSCPPGFTGKTCQMRGDWDPCITNPCGPYGNCVRQGASFICNCSGGFGGAYCNERVPNILSDGASLFHSRDIYIVGGLLGLIFILSVVLIFFCRRGNKSNQNSLKKGTQFHDYDDPLLGNPRVPRHGAPPVPPHANEKPILMKTTIANAPPLPPRLGRFRGDSCSPSSSNGKKKNGRSSSSEETHDREKYRRYGVPQGDSSVFSSRRGSSSGANNADISSSIPLLSKGNLNDSIQCLQTTEEIEINLDDPSEIEERNKMLDDLRRDQERLDSATSSYNREEPQDYVTMKPIHKIKPFTVSNSRSGQEIRDIDDESESAGKVPPPPPAHRTIPKSNGEKTTSTKLYDNPNNPNDDTLSNVTSNGLDE
ncbi:hypothetical protein FO519_002752 [Halicephalobus sp. NKZ332]|nr:hypothetical protein FO519_002752 [Halicephalobus sp. NKZ332]